MPITLKQQTALITGASRGIGRGIALKLAEQGVKRIAINYKENDAAAEDATRLLKERGAAPLLIKADIGKVAGIQRMFETIKSQIGSLDIFVSKYLTPGRFADNPAYQKYQFRLLQALSRTVIA